MRRISERLVSTGFALGLAVAAPQTVGIANADGADSTASAGADGSAMDAATPPRVRAGRAEHARSTAAGPRAGGSAGSTVLPKTASEVTVSAGKSPTSRPARVARTPHQPSRHSAPVVPSAVAVADTAAPAAEIGKAVVPEVFPADTAPTTVPSARRTATPAPAAVLITPTARLNDVLTGISHWLSGLPATPLTDFLSGALLLARRNLTPPATTARAVAASTADGNGPVLTGITSTPGSKQLVLTFDGPLIDSTATDLANYRITAPTWRNPAMVTSSGPALRIVAAEYSDISGSSSQVTLTLAHSLRQVTFYRVFINGELPIINGNPNSNPVTGGNGVTFDGDNDDTAGGDFYGLFAVGKRLSFKDLSGDRVVLSAGGGSGLNVWRELNGDIDQITVLPGATDVSGSVTPSKASTGTVYIGSVTIPVPTPLSLNGAVNNLPQSFVQSGGLAPPPPEPTVTSPTPVVATNQNLPYTVTITPVSAPGITTLPGIQSGVYAQMAPTRDYPSGLWVVFGGRTNGLHNFSPSGEQSFPPGFQNGVVYVINPADWQVWSLPWSQTNVTASVSSSLSSADQQFYQRGDTLYTVGGYSVPGTAHFTGTVTTQSNTIAVTSGLENLAVGQKVSGVLPFPSGQEIFPPGTLITGISGSTVTTSQSTEADGIDVSFAAFTSDFTTYDTLTALSIKGLADAVINGGDVTSQAKIRQMSDPRLAVTGGEMDAMNGRTYLVFGHNFQGGYNGATAGISQVYTNEVRSFRIVDTGRRLAIMGYQALRDPVNYRRRDGNLVSFVGNAGQPQLAYLGGVFTPGSTGTGYRAPIVIGPIGRVHIDSAYQQFFSQYATANIPLYDRGSRSMHDILLGGISLYDYANGQLNQDGALPWVDDVTSLVRARNGTFEEYIMPPIPAVTAGGTGNYGAYAAFFTDEALRTYRNGVIPLNQISGPTVVGYMYGGIYSTVANTTGNVFGQTGASNQVFQITVTPA